MSFSLLPPLFATLVACLLLFPALRAGPWAWGAGGGGAGPLALLPVAVAGLWGWQRLRARRLALGPAQVTLPLLVLTVLWALRPGAAEPLVLAAEVALVWLIYGYTLNERPRLTGVLALVAAGQGAVALAQFVLQRAVGLPALGELPLQLAAGVSVLVARGHLWLRAYGLTGHPNALGALLALMLLLLLPGWRQATGARRHMLMLAMLLGGAGLIVSFSRAAWLGFTVGLVVEWVRTTRQRARVTKQGSGEAGEWESRGSGETIRLTSSHELPRAPTSSHELLVVQSKTPKLKSKILPLLFLLCLLPISDLLGSRWVALGSPTEARSLHERWRDTQVALRLIADNPAGVGLGNFVTAARQVEPEALVVHSVPLLVGAELGWLGLGLWGALAALAGAGATRPDAPWLAWLTMSLFDVVLWPTSGLLGATVVALLAGRLAAGWEVGRAHAADDEREWSMVNHQPSTVSNSFPTSTRPIEDQKPGARLGGIENLAFGLLLLLAVLFPFETTEPLVRLGGVLVFSGVETLLLVTVGVWVLARVLARHWPHVPRGVALPVVAWLAVLLAAALLAPDERLHALKFWSRTLNGALLGWAAYDLTRARGRWGQLVRSLALAGALVGLLGVAEGFGVEPIAGWLMGFKRGIARVGELERVSSTLVFPTVASQVLELTLPLLLVWAATVTRRWARMLLGGALAASLLALTLTLTRAGIVLIGGGFLIIAAAAVWQRRRPDARPVLWGGLGAAGLLTALALLIFVANPVTRLRLISETEQTWYQARYASDPVPTLRPAQATTVQVRLVNTGVRAWRSDGARPFFLSYHLRRADGTVLRYDGARTPFAEPVPPGATVTVRANLVAPGEPGAYQVEWDMLQEDVAWFSWKGAPTLTVPLRVRGTAVATTLPPSPTPDPGVRLPTPTRRILWGVAWRMFPERPLLGYGPNTFRLRYGAFLNMPMWDPLIHANNMYIEWAVGSGILGLLTFGWASVALARRVRQGLDSHSLTWFWRVALATGLLAWYAHGLLDSFWEFTPTYTAFWLVAALALPRNEGNAKGAKNDAEDAQDQ